MQKPRIDGIDKVASRIGPHRAALVGLADEFGWAIAVCAADNGDVLAWDGWYTTDPGEGREPSDLRALDWRSDEDPNDLLHRAQADWLAGEVGQWISSSYSPSWEAAEEVVRRAALDTEPAAAGRLKDSRVVAYLQVHEWDVFHKVIEHHNIGSETRQIIDRLDVLEFPA
jgi:hypothetical protein